MISSQILAPIPTLSGGGLDLVEFSKLPTFKQKNYFPALKQLTANPTTAGSAHLALARGHLALRDLVATRLHYLKYLESSGKKEESRTCNCVLSSIPARSSSEHLREHALVAFESKNLARAKILVNALLDLDSTPNREVQVQSKILQWAAAVDKNPAREEFKKIISDAAVQGQHLFIAKCLGWLISYTEVGQYVEVAQFLAYIRDKSIVPSGVTNPAQMQLNEKFPHTLMDRRTPNVKRPNWSLLGGSLPLARSW